MGKTLRTGEATIIDWSRKLRFMDLDEIDRETDRACRAAQLLLNDIVHCFWYGRYDPRHHKIYLDNFSLSEPMLDLYLYEAFSKLQYEGWLEPVIGEHECFRATQKFIDNFEKLGPRSEDD